MEYFVGSFWAFVPAIIAIVLALVTKQVYLSLFAGIFVGGMFLAGGNPIEALQTIVTYIAAELGDNGGILIFLVVLGIMAVLLVKSGGSKAYAEWAGKKIKSSKSAELATVGLGVLIFVDDYFNCLTVGSAMRPITDKQKIPHSKLAYIIDSTAAPVCIIAPISSWAAAVSGYVADDGGIMTFIKTIPLNLYALLTIAFMIVTICLNFEFFKMGKNKKIALETGDLNAGETELPMDDIQVEVNPRGTVWHLLIPIIVLIVSCVGAMIYNGWSWLHTLSADELVENLGKDSFSILDCFSQCDSTIALAWGSIVGLIVTIIYYAISKVVTFKDCMNSIGEGFKSMVPAILILIFAWTLCAMMGAKGEGLGDDGKAILDGTLNAKAFIQANVSAKSLGLGVIPFIFFIIACLISFATGTSWGTFGVLLPIALAVVSIFGAGILYLTMAATLSGAVYGDHVSPISDTTIMASSGAQCNHIDHVRTQMPYATIVAAICGVSYLISGFIAQSGVSYGITVAVTLGIGIVVLLATIFVLNALNKKGVFEKKN